MYWLFLNNECDIDLINWSVLYKNEHKFVHFWEWDFTDILKKFLNYKIFFIYSIL